MIKVCQICGQEFEPGYKAYTRKYCYSCSPAQNRNEQGKFCHQQNPIRVAIKKELVKYKGGKCERCGYNKSLYALHFHHVNPNEKDFSLSEYFKKSSKIDMDLFKKEIDKCILVCANCHAEIHEELNTIGI